MKNYKVIEDNGGGLALVIYSKDGETIEYIHTGYEYNHGQLTEDLENLKNGDDPVKYWDGNELDDTDAINERKEIFPDTEVTDLEFWFPWEQKGQGWEIVADNDGIYPEDMGAAAREEFGIVEE